jgi:hypothetical protein
VNGGHQSNFSLPVDFQLYDKISERGHDSTSEERAVVERFLAEFDRASQLVSNQAIAIRARGHLLAQNSYR